MLDPQTLETKGHAQLGMLEHSKFFSAHSKIDRQTGEWLFFGLEFSLNLILHIIILDKNNRLKRHERIELPRNVYVHDFFVSERYIIIIPFWLSCQKAREGNLFFWDCQG